MMFRKQAPNSRRIVRRIVPRKVLKARAASSQNEFEEYETEAEPGMKLSQAFIVVLLLHVLAVGGIYLFNQFKEKPRKPVQPAPEVVRSESAPPPPVTKPAPEEVKTAQAPKPAATPAAAPAARRETYTVVAGDTLRRIAAKFDTTVEALEKANNLTSTSIIRTGQVLVVGSAPAAAAAKVEAQKPAVVAAKEEPKPVQAAPVAKPEAPAPGGKTYTVARGDNPYNIAKKFHTTQDALMKANNIDDPRKLQIGQKLVIP